MRRAPAHPTGTVGTLLALALAGAGGPVWAAPTCTQKCGFQCDAIAGGPFAYTNESGPTSATFIGSGPGSVSLSFTVTAPNESGDVVMFPGQGQNACTATADATVGVLEITQVADANGPLGTPVAVDPSSALFTELADAFAVSVDNVTFTPESVPASFSPGSSVPVYVHVSNPDVATANLGEYDVKLAAHAPGAGIGVGPGIEFDLTLQAATQTDTAPCVPTISSPTNAAQTLGPIGVSIQAYDPSPGSGLHSLTASISSAGGAVSNVNIPLTLDHSLDQPAGVTVSGTGNYSPNGAAGSAGTTDALAFLASSPSGIGTYTITATCTDVAGNVGQATVTFAVNYALSFTQSFVPAGCPGGSPRNPSYNNCRAMFKFGANRSSTTSDGAFLFDHTVRVNLVGSANSSSNSCTNSSLATQSHGYGTGSINSYTQIDTTTPQYQTNFDGSNTSVVPFGSYVAQVCFDDVDGNPDLQATSSSLSF